jgi:hypothetical protein
MDGSPQLDPVQGTSGAMYSGKKWKKKKKESKRIESVPS